MPRSDAGAGVSSCPGSRLAPPASRIEAGSGAEIRQAALGRSVMDPAMLGEAADGIMSMFAGSAVRVVRMPPSAFGEAWSLLARIEAEAAARRPGRELMQRLAAVELLMLIYRCWRSSREAGPTGPARFRIEEAEAFVRDHYAEELSLADVASRFGFNPSYFSRLFAGRTGVPLFAYVNRLRIQKSCVFLKRSSMGIAEIAFSVGYSNLSHFNRCFRRIMAMTPREYRKRSGK